MYLLVARLQIVLIDWCKVHKMQSSKNTFDMISQYYVCSFKLNFETANRQISFIDPTWRFRQGNFVELCLFAVRDVGIIIDIIIEMSKYMLKVLLYSEDRQKIPKLIIIWGSRLKV